MTEEERDFILIACANYLLGVDTTYDNGTSDRVGKDSREVLKKIIQRFEHAHEGKFEQLFTEVRLEREQLEHNQWLKDCKAARRLHQDLPEYKLPEV